MLGPQVSGTVGVMSHQLHVDVGIPEPSEARNFADLCARTFRETYRGLVPKDALDAYISEAFNAARQRRELEDPATTVYLAGSARQPLGYALVRRGSSPEEVTGRSPLELGRLYVDEPARGKGVGGVLFAQVMQEALTAGHDQLWLTVWEHNVRAIEVYTHWGFLDVGAISFDFAGEPQTDRVMARPSNWVISTDSNAVSVAHGEAHTTQEHRWTST